MMTRNMRKIAGGPKRAGLVFCLLCLSLFWAGSAMAEDVTYNGSADDYKIKNLPVGPTLVPDSPSDNTVVVSDDINANVAGGLDDQSSTTDDAEASANDVSISGSDVNGGVIGGVAESDSGTATASGNSVIVSDNSSSYYVAGGDAESDSGAATASNNSVAISGSEANGEVDGGYAESDSGAATASDNSVIVSDSSINGYVIGGDAESDSGTATASNNSVTISDSEVSYGSVYGSYAGSTSGTATASNNNVNINDSEVNGYVVGGNAGSDSGVATASNNNVSVSGNVIAGYVDGGDAYSTDGTATASNNNVNISGSEIYSVSGGYAMSVNGAATASNNTATISDSKVNWDVVGGYARSTNGAATASNNTITISNSEMNGVLGGYAWSTNDVSTATHNNVTLSGATKINSNLIGGLGNTNPGSDFFTGNTLHVFNPDKASGIIVGGDVSIFQFYNFTYQADAVDGAVGLTVDGTAYLHNLLSGALRTSVIDSVNVIGGGDPLPEGHTFKLIDGALDDGGVFKQDTVTGKKGAALLLNYDLDIDAASGLTATLTSIQAHPQAKALSEGRAAGAAFINSGGDLIAETGMSNAGGRSAGNFGSFTFGGASYGSSKIETGSHADVKGFSVMGGIGKDFQKASGRLTLGAFLEGGWGSYDAFNDFAGYSSINSSGDTNYYGLGIAARFDGNGDERGHFYGDGSLRFGKTETDFTSNLFDVSGAAASYDSDASYFGAHFGFGYVRNLTESSDLDLYTKLLWTRQGSDTVTTSTGDPVKFDSTDSVRWRTGLRYGRLAGGDKFRWYIGAAYEHEFGGDADATAYGAYAIDAPSLEGGTGIGEIGFTYRKSPTDPFSLDLNVSGYTGQRDGVSGRLEMNWTF
jgi:hypothetical protein